jgi:hypothetical protein
MESSTVFGGKKEESSLADKTQEISSLCGEGA